MLNTFEESLKHAIAYANKFPQYKSRVNMSLAVAIKCNIKGQKYKQLLFEKGEETLGYISRDLIEDVEAYICWSTKISTWCQVSAKKVKLLPVPLKDDYFHDHLKLVKEKTDG